MGEGGVGVDIGWRALDENEKGYLSRHGGNVTLARSGEFIARRALGDQEGN